jgi:hypothetical protein
MHKRFVMCTHCSHTEQQQTITGQHVLRYRDTDVHNTPPPSHRDTAYAFHHTLTLMQPCWVLTAAAQFLQAQAPHCTQSPTLAIASAAPSWTTLTRSV